MPRTYIARLLFVRRHTSLAIISDDPALKDPDEEVIGSICYRTFPVMRSVPLSPCALVAEIAFCAVNALHQVKVGMLCIVYVFLSSEDLCTDTSEVSTPLNMTLHTLLGHVPSYRELGES
jgi:hypothetical protein